MAPLTRAAQPRRRESERARARASERGAWGRDAIISTIIMLIPCLTMAIIPAILAARARASSELRTRSAEGACRRRRSAARIGAGGSGRDQRRDP